MQLTYEPGTVVECPTGQGLFVFERAERACYYADETTRNVQPARVVMVEYDEADDLDGYPARGRRFRDNTRLRRCRVMRVLDDAEFEQLGRPRPTPEC